MPRKQFIADLQQATTSAQIAKVHDIHPGEDDGQITFLFAQGTLERPITVTASVTGEYTSRRDQR